MRFLSNPSQFHSCLLQAIKGSKSTIYLSTLYLGDSMRSSVENSLRLELYNALERGVRVHILADYSRSSRPRTNEEWIKAMEKRYTNQFEVNYFACSQPAIPITPSPFREIFGLFHFKLNTFDDDQILITGANLSDTYFTNRQDRYLWIENERNLTGFCKSLLDRLRSLSFQTTKRLPPDACPFTNPQRFQKIAQIELEELSNPRMFTSQSFDNLWFWPVLQLNGLGVANEHRYLSPLLNPKLDAVRHITSPYFNFPPEYHEPIADSCNDIHILTAAPQSNGFYGAKGLKQYIPEAYAALESKFLNQVSKNPNINLYNYNRAGWSYHGKGIWVTPLAKNQNPSSFISHLPLSSQTENTTEADGRLPVLTTIGSSNYGYRSLYRDLEFQMIIYTKSKDLQKLMSEDQQNLWRYANKRHCNDPGAKTSWWIPAVLPFVKTMF